MCLSVDVDVPNIVVMGVTSATIALIVSVKDV